MRSSKARRNHIITTAVRNLFLAMLSAQLCAGRVCAQESASTDQKIGIEADLIAEEAELAGEPVLSKERPAADDAVPEAYEGAPADSEPASETAPEPIAGDAEPASEAGLELALEDAEPVEEGEPADEGLAQEAGHEPAPEDTEPARGDAESVHAEAPEPAAKDTEAAPAAEDPFPAIDDQGPAGEGSSQPAENSPDSKEAPEFSCLDDLLPHNGIPLVIIRIDEDDGNSAIDEMNGSRDHSVKCTGTVEIRFPDGYSVGQVYFGTTTEEMALEYIRGRGNSTWGAPKKPYKIKFDSKQDLLDMGKSKEWALMANSMDPTAMKNRITYELGEMMGLGESLQLVPVEVVMIGSQTEAEYLGLYDLSETIKFEKSRLDLKTPDEDATQEEGSGNITGSYMISIYNWLQDGNDPPSNHFTTDTMNDERTFRIPVQGA